jgi:glycine/D-amino acid oxidase-like deaminating enzyme
LLRAASPQPYWLDRDDVEAPPPREPIEGATEVELLVVGAGLTGLWAAFEAAQDGHEVLAVDSGAIGSGASGRCGGFINSSITHGIPHGHARWPDEMAAILAIQRALWADTLRLVGGDGVIEPVGKFTVATRAHHVESIRRTVGLLQSYAEDVTAYDRVEIQERLGSATYVAGYHLRSANGLCDPTRLAWRLADLAESAGARVAERSHVARLRHRGDVVYATVADGSVVHARKVLLCTNASPPLLRRLHMFVAPVYDHVIVTEPLPAELWRAIGWREPVGITDAGNQFHYYRPTPDGRILFGGWEATYHFGGRVDERHERDAAIHALLHRHLVDTFPALGDVAVTHAWGGAVDSTSRFTPTMHTAASGRIGWAIGFTGLGVGASRFGALAALDLLLGRRTERTELALVRRQPIPFPPEPLRWAAIQYTKHALVREDATGRRGLWLRALDRLGVGFDT